MKQLKNHIRTLLILAMLSCGLAVAASATAAPITAQAAAVKINKKNVTLNKGKTYQLKLSGTNKKAVWKSSKPAVAKVSSTGKVTAKKAGKTKITAKVNKKNYTCNVTVEAPKINKQKVTLEVGETCQLKMSGTKQKVTWTSSDKKVAAVTAKGKVTAKKAGTAKISAKVNGGKFTCTVTVKAKKVNNSAKSGREKLKEYILRYGSTNSKGKKFIKWTDWYEGSYSEFGIVYDSAKRNFDFIMNREDYYGAESSLGMTVPDRDVDSLEAEYLWFYGYAGYTARGTFNIRTYTSDTYVHFTIEDATGLSASDLSDARDLANASLQLGMAGWDLLLVTEVGITMKDIGFASYE